MNEELQPGRDLTPEQQRRADALSKAQIKLIERGAAWQLFVALAQSGVRGWRNNAGDRR